MKRIRHAPSPPSPASMRRRTALAWLGLGGVLSGLSACGNDSSAGKAGSASLRMVSGTIRTGQASPNALHLFIDAQASGRDVNRLVLGQNLQWVDRGDEMFNAQGAIRADMLAVARELGTPMLRYPGGLQSDTYHWQQGMGEQSERGNNMHANAGTLQKVIVGTREFLELCEALGAQPLITVNVPTGSAEEAAAWLRQVNIDGLVSSRTGQKLPKVTWWELGNEPYLQPQELRSAWMTAAAFGKKARQFAQAMRAVDPSIQLILPLTNDTRNGFPATPMPGFTREVLSQSFDAGNAPNAIALHNAYVPLGLDKAYSLDQLYWGAMAGSRTVQADLAAMRSLIDAVQPGNGWKFAITEFNSLFTLGSSDTDTLPQAPVGALAVADVLRVLATHPDVSMAQFWSLSGNGFFGVVQAQGGTQARGRPVHQVLSLLNEALHGQWLPLQLSAPTIGTPSIGGTAAVADLPIAEALVTRQGSALRILLIHKDPTNAATLQLDLGGQGVHSAHLSVLHAKDVFDRSDQNSSFVRTDVTLMPTSAQTLLEQLASLPLPSASVALLTLSLAN
jgi:alpha-N-arabinofuranosidase